MAELRNAQDTIALLRSENDRLRNLFEDSQRDHRDQIAAVVNERVAADARCTELRLDHDRLVADSTRMHGELQDSLVERDRLAQVVQDVRRQVDGKLTKLMEELLRKDEEIHRLEYIVREREKDRERATLLDRMLASREENVTSLAEEVSGLRNEVRTLEADKARLEANVSIAKREAASMRRSQSPTKESSPASQLLPLYRQWIGDMERDMFAFENVVDGLDGEISDLQLALEIGRVERDAKGAHDRQRLLEMKKMERERMERQHQKLIDSAALRSDPVALNVQAIRSGCDNCKYGFEKVNATIKGLLETTKTLRATVDTMCPTGLAKAAKAEAPATAVAAEPVTPARAPSTPPPPASPSPASNPYAPNEYTNQLHDQIAQLRDELLAKSEEMMKLKSSVMEATYSSKNAEMMTSQRSADAERLGKEVEVMRANKSNLESQLREALDSKRIELEKASSKLREVEGIHTEKMRKLQHDHDEALVELRSSQEKAFAQTHADSEAQRREIASLTDTIERMKAVLQESKEKRVSLKQQRERLNHELREVRMALSAQGKELTHARDVAEALEAELEAAKKALLFEAQQQEAHYVGAADEGAMFREWKRGHSSAAPEPSSAIFVPTNPKGRPSRR